MQRLRQAQKSPTAGAWALSVTGFPASTGLVLSAHPPRCSLHSAGTADCFPPFGLQRDISAIHVKRCVKVRGRRVCLSRTYWAGWLPYGSAWAVGAKTYARNGEATLTRVASSVAAPAILALHRDSSRSRKVLARADVVKRIRQRCAGRAGQESRQQCANLGTQRQQRRNPTAGSWC